MDGDGGLYVTRVKSELAFWSTHDQDWGFVQDLFAELGHPEALRTVKYDRKKGKHRSSMTATWRRDAIRAFTTYVYQGDDWTELGMARKHLKHLDLVSLPLSGMTCTGQIKRSRYKYVIWIKSKSKWKGFIWRLNRTSVGLFDTEEAAHEAVQRYLALHDTKSRHTDYVFDK